MEKSYEEKRKEMIDAFHRIWAVPIDSSAAFIAAAVISDNAGSGMREEVKAKFAGLAFDIQQLAYDKDEPRFCLYDYLDACMNGNILWYGIADQLEQASKNNDKKKLDELFDMLVKMAAEKREVYSR